MSPIPSVATAFALSTAAPSTALDPDSAGQSASMLSRHLFGTGGFVFAVVALVSVASYFYHGRGAANNTGTGNTWTSFTGLLSSMRRRGPTAASEPATHWAVDIENGFEATNTLTKQHVNMVYAKFFHPTFWNVVECHLATPSAPAIYVEDEAIDTPASEPKLPGMNSFLNMDDDADADNGTKLAHEKPDCKALPPYNTSFSTDVNFNSQIIGATVRPGAFLSVPGELEASTDCSSSDTEADAPCPPYDGIATTDSNSDFTCSPYDGIVTMETRSSSGTRRFGVADMAHFARSLEDTIPKEGHDLVPTISCRTGLLDLSNFVKTDPISSCGRVERLEPADEWIITNFDVSVHDSCDGTGGSLGHVNIPAMPPEGPDLMRRLLAELRDPDLDFSPRPLSDDSDSEHSGDDGDDEAGVPCQTRPLTPHFARRNSLESTFALETDSDVSDEGPIYPFTPPSRCSMSLPSALDIKVHVLSPFRDKFNEKAVMSPPSPDSLPSLPTKAHVRSHRDSRSLLYGPRVPLAKLPRL